MFLAPYRTRPLKLCPIDAELIGEVFERLPSGPAKQEIEFKFEFEPGGETEPAQMRIQGSKNPSDRDRSLIQSQARLDPMLAGTLYRPIETPDSYKMRSDRGRRFAL
jgi:hypothetical protein